MDELTRHSGPLSFACLSCPARVRVEETNGRAPACATCSDYMVPVNPRPAEA
jgi:hypothetical protein